MAENSADFFQTRGAAMDIIDEAINEYRGFMLDDDYDAQATLERIMARMVQRRADLTVLSAKSFEESTTRSDQPA